MKKLEELGISPTQWKVDYSDDIDKRRNFAEAFETPNRRSKYHCMDCPVWNLGICSVRAAVSGANHPICRYGLERINSVSTSERAARRSK